MWMWVGRADLEGVGGGETIIRMYYIKKKVFNKKKGNALF